MEPEVVGAARTSFARGLNVFSTVLDRGEVRAEALAADLELPVSTVYRYLRDLCAAGFVVQSGGAYHVGDRLGATRGGVPSRTELRRLARPILESLTAATGESSLIVVRSHTQALCLDQVESQHAMRMAFRVGQALPLYAGAASRVLLAYVPDDVLEAVLVDLEPVTAATPGADDLPRRLRTIRDSGVATSRSEFVEGAVAIAAPVLTGDACVCSLAIAAPAARASAAWQREAKTLLRQACEQLVTLLVFE
jgi:DNA-binding IclR family transcriptional regulator